ncbi:ABC transporter substrate-binding protein (plasmid) [Sulfitobacter sp. LCG007]
MTYITRMRTALGGALLAAAMMAGPAVQAAPEELTIALSSDFPTLDPSKDTSPIALNYRLNVFEALTKIGKNGEVIPQIAESWEHSDDLKTWTFHIRKGVKFHNGYDMTAHDVVWTVERILADDKTPVRNFLKQVETVEAPDDYTVVFKIKAAYAIFDRQTKYTYVMSRKYWEEVGDDGYATKPVGTGPYKMVEWVKDDKMVLEFFPDWWGGELPVKKATFRPIPSDAGRANALLSGEVDIVPDLPPSLVPMLENDPNLIVAAESGFRVAYLGMNPTVAPFDNPKLREAVDYAIDREAIAEKLMRGTGKATGIIIPPNNEGYTADFEPVQYDPEKAKALVKESGYDGTPVVMDYPNNNFALANEQAQAIAGYLKEAGINVELNSLEFTAYFPKWVQNQLDKMTFFAFGSSQFHAETILGTMYEAGTHNWSADPEIDKMVKAQREEADKAKQQEIITAAFRRGNELREFLPLWDINLVYGATKDAGYEPFPDGIVRLDSFE